MIVTATVTIIMEVSVTDSMEDPERRRRWVLFVVLLCQFMLVLDTSIVSLALRAIQADLAMPAAQLAWVTSGYLVAFGGLLLFFGRLSDLVGRRPVFLFGLWLFTAASLGCGLAPSAGTLIAARFIQGIGAAASSSVVLAIIAIEFPEAQARAKAMSLYALVSICGGSAGLLVGGLLTQATAWHSIFLINIPIGLFALRVGYNVLQAEVTPGIDRTLDVGGALTVTIGSMALIYSLVELASHAATSVAVLLPGIGAVVLLTTFVIFQRRVTNPLMPPRIWRIKSLMVASLTRTFVIVAIYGAWFLGALELAQARGFGPIQTGLAFLPQTTVVAVFSLGLTTRLMRRFGARAVLVAGLSAIAVALATLSQHDPATPYFPWRMLSLVCMGIGGGLAFVPLMVIAMRDVPPRDAGLGSAIVNVAQQLSAAFGLAVLGSLAAYRTDVLIGRAVDTTNALVLGYHLAYEVAAVGVLVAMVIAALMLRDTRPLVAPASAGSSRQTSEA
jgi:EmrB/QacA subfamily drug resistance transporter